MNFNVSARGTYQQHAGHSVAVDGVRLNPRVASNWKAYLPRLAAKIGRKVVTAFDPEFKSGVRDRTGKERRGCYVVLKLEGVVGKGFGCDPRSGLFVPRTLAKSWVTYWYALHPDRDESGRGYPFDLSYGPHAATAIEVLEHWHALPETSAEARHTAMRRWLADEAFRRAKKTREDQETDVAAQTRPLIEMARSAYGTLQDAAAVKAMEEQAERVEEYERAQAEAQYLGTSAAEQRFEKARSIATDNAARSPE